MHKQCTNPTHTSSIVSPQDELTTDSNAKYGALYWPFVLVSNPCLATRATYCLPNHDSKTKYSTMDRGSYSLPCFDRFIILETNSLVQSIMLCKCYVAVVAYVVGATGLYRASTSPIFLAVSGSTVPPASIIFNASCNPTRRGNRTVYIH